jgi:uncharacterized protein (TIGR02147 family)
MTTPNRKNLSVDIFSFLDYRSFLKSYYEACKKSDPKFTYRYIAEFVGFKSAGHLTQILNGSTNISDSLAAGFVEFLKFGKQEASYFETLVHFNQAKTHSEKKHFFERLLKFKKLKSAVITPDQYEYFDKWYYVAIREVLSYYQFTDDFAGLAQQLKPAISPDDAKKTIELLIRLNLISKNEKGFYEKIDPVLSANPEGKALAITNNALETMRLAGESIDRFPKEQRNISGVTFSISQKTFDTIQEEVRNFRKRILDIAQCDATPDGVYQFNVQLFPLTDIPVKTTEGNAQCV